MSQSMDLQTAHVKKGLSFSRIIAIFGNVLEHNDKALFVLLAPFISPQVFPNEDPLVGLIEMYSLLVLSLIVRPIGAFVMGKFADRYGRRKALVLSMWGMSFATFGMGLLPPFASVGFFAPLLLFFFRSMQNFFGPSETTISAVYILELSDKKWRAFASSIFESSTMLGILLASCEMTLFAYFNILETHWQWLFLGLGAVGGLLALFQKGGIETEKGTKKSLTMSELWRDRKILFILALTASFSYATYIFSITFINNYLKVITSMGALELSGMNTALTLFDLLTLPLFGVLAIRYTSGKMMYISTLLASVISLPLFLWMDYSESFNVIMAARLVVVLLGVSFAAGYRAWTQDLVGGDNRCTLLNVGGSIGQLIAEGPITLVCLSAMKGGIWIGPAVVLSSLGAMTAIALRRLAKQDAA